MSAADIFVPPTARLCSAIDAMLAQHVRAQLLLAGLCSGFYSASMALLGFPIRWQSAFPARWIPPLRRVAPGAAILGAGSLTHANWIAMVMLLVVHSGIG